MSENSLKQGSIFEMSVPDKISLNQFDIEHNETVEKYYSPDFITPNPNLSTQIVFPVYNELNNDNFWKIIESLINQTNKDSSSIELVFVVNNVSSISKTSEAYLSNQKLIRIIQEYSRMLKLGNFSNDDLYNLKTELGLTINEINIFTKALEKNLIILGIDASSDTKSIEAASYDEPIGIARNIGAHIAVARLNLLEDQGFGKRDAFIHFLDADCYLSPEYVSNLLKFYNTEAKVIINPVIDIIDHIPPLEKNTSLGRLEVLKYFQFDLPRHRRSYLLIRPGGQDFFQDCSGPHLAIRSSLLRDIQGYPKGPANREDFLFTNIILSGYHDTIVNSHGSWMSARVGRTDGKNRAFTVTVVEDFNSYRKHSNSYNELESDSIQNMIRFNKSMEEKYGNRYLSARRLAFEREKDFRNKFIDKSKIVLDLAIEFISIENINPVLLGDRLIQLAQTQADIPIWFEDFINQNQSFLQVILDIYQNLNEFSRIYKASNLSTLIYKILESEFPNIYKYSGSNEPNYSWISFYKRSACDYIHIYEAAVMVEAEKYNDTDRFENVHKARLINELSVDLYRPLIDTKDLKFLYGIDDNKNSRHKHNEKIKSILQSRRSNRIVLNDLNLIIGNLQPQEISDNNLASLKNELLINEFRYNSRMLSSEEISKIYDTEEFYFLQGSEKLSEIISSRPYEYILKDMQILSDKNNSKSAQNQILIIQILSKNPEELIESDIKFILTYENQSLDLFKNTRKVFTDLINQVKKKRYVSVDNVISDFPTIADLINLSDKDAILLLLSQYRDKLSGKFNIDNLSPNDLILLSKMNYSKLSELLTLINPSSEENVIDGCKEIVSLIKQYIVKNFQKFTAILPELIKSSTRKTKITFRNKYSDDDYDDQRSLLEYRNKKWFKDDFINAYEAYTALNPPSKEIITMVNELIQIAYIYRYELEEVDQG